MKKKLPTVGGSKTLKYKYVSYVRALVPPQIIIIILYYNLYVFKKKKERSRRID